jgi:hypothetical protein
VIGWPPELEVTVSRDHMGAAVVMVGGRIGHARGVWDPKGERGMTSTLKRAPQRMLALERANEIRCASAQLKERVGAGHLSAAEVILDLSGGGEPMAGSGATRKPAPIG